MRYACRVVALHPDDRLFVTPATRLRDYILTPYEPAAPALGALHPKSLLRHLLRRYEMLAEVWPICEALREALGDDETVWGFKLGPAGPSLELYLYRFTNERGEVDERKSTTNLAAILAPWIRFEALADEAQPYFMASFEIGAAAARARDGGAFRIYVGAGDEARHKGGFSYRVEHGATVLENHYAFYHPAEPNELADAVRRVMISPRAGAKPCWGTLLPRYLRDCFTICVAVKPRADGLYFSRIGSAQLARFLRGHHPPIASVLEAHAAELAPLRWDLGFDYAAPGKSATHVAIDKIGIHGVF
jgi:hypothetical protein